MRDGRGGRHLHPRLWSKTPLQGGGLGSGRKLIQPQFGPGGRALGVADPIFVEVIGSGVVPDREVDVKVAVGHGHIHLLKVDLRGFPQKGGI